MRTLKHILCYRFLVQFLSTRMSNDKSVKVKVLEKKNEYRKVYAVVRSENFGNGSTVSINNEQKKQLGIDGDYHAGHIIAKMLGGSGSDVNNLVPMHKSFNNSAYKSFEFEVRKMIEDSEKFYPGKQVEARITVSLFYNQGSKKPYRIKYDVAMYANGVEKPSYVGDFKLNENGRD